MHSIRVNKVISLMISAFYLIGLWHRRDKATVRELRIKWLYCIYYLLFVVSLVVGAITNGNEGESIFLTEASIGATLLAIKLWLLIWKQDEIVDFLNRVCVFSIQNEDDYNRVSDKLRGFAKFVIGFVIASTVTGLSQTMVVPFFGSEKSLFLEIAFPLNWKTNTIAFWIATFFYFSEVILSFTAVIFSVIIWYLLLMCSLRYEVLGSELKRMGRSRGERRGKTTEQQMYKSYLEDLKASIDAHLHLRKLTDELGCYFSKLFFTQFGTSGLCICGSIYCLAFDIGDNLLERFIFLLAFLYLTADIFMVTYFGNEIKLSSNRLSYSLFESDWYEQPHSTKKCIIIFGEYLKQPQELVVGKLYPLTLETFTRILKSSYSMFNVLKTFQQK